MDETKLAKLPKWAQEQILVLERNVEHWRAKVQKVDSGDAAVWSTEWDFPKPLALDAVEFRMPNGQRLDIRLDAKSCALRVQASGLGFVDRLVVMPESTNVVSIAFRDRVAK